MNAAALNEKSRLVSYPAFKWELYSKVITGGVLAIFIYFLFMSGLLSGEGGTGFIISNLFPVFSFPKNTDLLVMRDVLDFSPRHDGRLRQASGLERYCGLLPHVRHRRIRLHH